MKQFTTITLIADEGMVLTNGEIYGKVIALGNGDSAENYHEITEAEYDAVMAERAYEAELDGGVG